MGISGVWLQVWGVVFLNWECTICLQAPLTVPATFLGCKSTSSEVHLVKKAKVLVRTLRAGQLESSISIFLRYANSRPGLDCET